MCAGSPSRLLEDAGYGSGRSAIAPLKFQWQGPELKVFAYQLVQVDEVLNQRYVLAQKQPVHWEVVDGGQRGIGVFIDGEVNRNGVRPALCQVGGTFCAEVWAVSVEPWAAGFGFGPTGE